MGFSSQIYTTSIKLTLNKQQQLTYPIMESQNQYKEDGCVATEHEDQPYDGYELGYGNEMCDQSLSQQVQPAISFFQMYALPNKIWEEIIRWAFTTGMSKGWTLILAYFRDFTQERINEVIDCDYTGRNIIHFVEGYEPNVFFMTCGVCCLEKTVYSNPCDHSFCLDCWTSHLKNKLESGQLFPFCQEDGCSHRMNYQLMELFFEENTEIKTRFQRLLCYKYCQKSPRVRLCPLNRCEKVLFINSMTDSKVMCQCGTIICKQCGFFHFPLTCSDLSNWKTKMVTNENQWINITAMQKCPLCKQPIIKTNGCIHMKCRCSHQFCWICLKVWAGHSSYQACASISLEEHEKTLKIQQYKRFMNINQYNERFEEAKSETERLSYLTKLLSDESKDLMHSDVSKLKFIYSEVVVLESMRQFAIKIWELQIYVRIYNFFQKEHSGLMIQMIKPLSNFASRIDDFIRVMIREKMTDIQSLKKQTQIMIEDMGGIFEQIREWFSREMYKLLNEFNIAKGLYAQFQSGEILHTLKSMAREQEERMLYKMQTQEYQLLEFHSPITRQDQYGWQHIRHQQDTRNIQLIDQVQIQQTEERQRRIQEPFEQPDLVLSSCDDMYDY